MPIHYQRDDAKQRINVRSEGMPTLEEVLAIMNRQAAEGVWSYAVLYDSRGATRAPISKIDCAPSVGATHAKASGMKRRMIDPRITGVAA